jgi:hypothetical protein
METFEDIFETAVVLIICFGVTCFSLVQSKIYNSLHYDNGKHLGRFIITLILSIAVGCALPMVDNSGWTLPPLALALSLFSNTVTGLVAYSMVVGLCCYIASASVHIFLIYFIVGIMFAVLFERLDNEYKTGKPLAISFLFYVVIMAIWMVLDGKYIIPVTNIFITFILTVAILRFYCAVVVDKKKGAYITINDQEYKLLSKYKEIDSGLYYNAIHTAYFAEKTARILGLDIDLAKNGGYYHRIIVQECKREDKSLEDICSENRFPPEAVELLKEFNYKSQHLKMKETVAVYLADCVVSSIMYLVKKDNGKEVDYGKIAVAVIHKKLDSGILDKSDISLSDLGEIDKIYTGEKLYYDFLRRE